MTQGEPIAGPRIALKAGTRVIIGRPDDRGARLMTFKRRIGPRSESKLEFVYGEEGEHYLALTDEQIAFLCQQGEFNIVISVGGEDRPVPPSPIQLTEEQVAYGERCKAYVLACLALGDRYRRSHPVLEPPIKKLFEERGDDEKPGVTTVLNWIDLWEGGGAQYGIAVFIMLRRNGNGHADLGDAMHNAVSHGVRTALGTGTAQEALRHAQNWLEANHPDIPRGDDDMPSIRTIQRRMASTNRYVADACKFGARRARRKHAIAYETKLPLLPLEEVEVDNTPLDMICVDESRSMLFGRPNLLSFRDRATGSVLGLSLGWEAPSYASFMDGLQHAFYPKKREDTPAAEMDWYAWGRPRRLYVDNALEFIGNNIQHAAARMQFQLAEFRPGNPWLKGAQERLFRELNMQMHKLPGTTFSDILKRRDRAEIVRLPILTRREIWDFLSVYICDIYHHDKHEGLGFLRALKDIPAKKWAEAAAKGFSIAPLGPADDFIALAGDTTFKSISKKAIRWDHLRYGSAALESLRTHPEHRDGRTDGDWAGRKHEGSKYETKRHPFDVSRVVVINPYDRHARPIEVPAMRQDYAAGLTLHQHRVIVANANRKLLANPKEGEDPEDELIRAKRRLAAAIEMFQEVRTEQGIASKLARFLYQGRSQEKRSVITARPFDSQASRRPLDPSKKASTPSSSPAAGGREPPDPRADLGRPDAGPNKDRLPQDALASELGETRPKRRASPTPHSEGADLDEDFDVEARRRRIAQDDKWKSV